MGVRGWREVGLDELIEDRSRVTVSNCEVTGFETGIDIIDSNGVTLQENVVHDNAGIGIRVLRSPDTALISNESSGNAGRNVVRTN